MRLMSRWGVEPNSRAEVLNKLIADKFIDDRRYAQAYIREKINLSGWGSRKIASSLKSKGIAESITSELLCDLDPETMEKRLLLKLERKASSIKYKDTYDKRSKLIRFALSLGYDYDMVQDAVSHVITIDDE